MSSRLGSHTGGSPLCDEQRHTVVFVHATGTCRPWAAHLRGKMAQAAEHLLRNVDKNTCNF